jgi:hypothetical protein
MMRAHNNAPTVDRNGYCVHASIAVPSTRLGQTRNSDGNTSTMT